MSTEGVKDDDLKERTDRYRWFREQLHDEDVNPSTRELLEQYSEIPSSEILPHILKIRQRAWDIYPYPCIGQFRFLDLSVGKTAQYQEILSRIKSDHHFLDIGCCFGQDIRRLVFDGAPVANLHGSDLEQPFIDLGYDLFLDEAKLPKSTFLTADVFAEESKLNDLAGKMDIVHAASFFHLFDLEKGTKAAKKIISLLRRQPGSMVLGRQMGNETPGEKATKHSRVGSAYRHNPGSFTKWWNGIGESMGTKWEVMVEFDGFVVKLEGDEKTESLIRPGDRRLRFCMRML